MKTHLISIICILVIAFSSCKKDKQSTTYTMQYKSCTEQAFSGKNIKICFDSLITDQRCPIDAVCISPGHAIAAFTISVDNASLEIQLSPESYTLNSPAKTDIQFKGFNFYFKELNPLPFLSNPVDTSDYSAVINVTD